ncbi:MAG: NUDIX domain-containing protein [Clostridiales bacterium]|nr:NUDIX domain-containing protein [Clostridiales bacterium]
MELWDLYDIQRLKLGKTHERGKPLDKGEYHLVVHVCIFNSKGQMLIQQRQPFKEGWPNLWDITIGGSVVRGETSQMGAHRELLEEIGYDYNFEGVRPHITLNFVRGFDDVYLIQQDLDPAALTLQYEEVQRVKWATREEIQQMIIEKTFIHYHPPLIDLFFELRHTYNSIVE